MHIFSFLTLALLLMFSGCAKERIEENKIGNTEDGSIAIKPVATASPTSGAPPAPAPPLPTVLPTADATANPTAWPTAAPTAIPTIHPTAIATSTPVIGVLLEWNISKFDFGNPNEVVTKNFILINRGSLAAKEIGVWIDGPKKRFRMTVDHCNGLPLGPQESCEMTIEFNGQKKGKGPFEAILKGDSQPESKNTANLTLIGNH